MGWHSKKVNMKQVTLPVDVVGPADEELDDGPASAGLEAV